MEHKDTKLNAFKTVDTKEGIVQGYLAFFGNVDSYGDVIQKGAFKKTIQEAGARAKYLFQHDFTQPIGKFTELKEDEAGLYFEAKLSKAPTVQEKLLMIEEGILEENSIGYEVVKSMDVNTEERKFGRDLFELKLFEGSLVTYAANSLARITGIKSNDATERLKAAYDRLNKISNYLKKTKMADDNNSKLIADEVEKLSKQIKEDYDELKSKYDELNKELEDLKNGKKATDNESDDKSTEEEAALIAELEAIAEVLND